MRNLARRSALCVNCPPAVRPNEYLTNAALSDTNDPINNKVLMVTPVTPWGLVGGTATVSRNLISLFSEHVDLHVCCLRSDEPGAYPRRHRGTTILSGNVSVLGRRIKVLFDFRPESFADRQFQRAKVLASFAKLLAEQRPQFVIFDHIYSSWLIDAVKNRGIILTYIAHDDMVVYADSLIGMKPGPLMKMRFASLRSQYCSLQNKVLQRCDFLLTLTDGDAALLEKTYRRGPTDVVPLYFDPPGFIREYPANFDSLLVTGSFDTWEKQRGLAVFLESIFMPLVRMAPDLRLIIAGRFPGAFGRKLCLLPHLKIVNGPSEIEMREIFHRASAAAVLDLQASGLKIKTIELAAAGLPLVSWASGLEGTKLINGRSCLLAQSATEFIGHLARLFSDPESRRQLGVAARRTIETEFSRQAASARLKKLKFFDALANAGAVRSAPS
jgi:glycosyltransferase involved in cell wall biosynthesis